AVALARAVNYCGAGTLEYLYDPTTKEFFFIEMNTRIQVEHPVTEMITGTDLVQEMIRVCGGEALSMTQPEITRTGHAIEVRLNAEDPLMQFMPWPGVVGALKIPEGAGIRFDHFLYEGYTIPPFYDSLLGKLIVHGTDRADAIARMSAALEELEIGGIKTTAPLHKALARDASVQADKFHTQWLEPWLDAGNLTTSANGGQT
ncbi:MAG: acetyl-CoA carboxylase biotin carboxylase subunit, partial [Roseovarius sp.]